MEERLTFVKRLVAQMLLRLDGSGGLYLKT